MRAGNGEVARVACAVAHALDCKTTDLSGTRQMIITWLAKSVPTSRTAMGHGVPLVIGLCLGQSSRHRGFQPLVVVAVALDHGRSPTQRRRHRHGDGRTAHQQMSGP
jgi:hypothetical protein